MAKDTAKQARPQLTSVKQDFSLIAQSFVELLFARMAGEDPPSLTLPVSLKIRASAPNLGMAVATLSDFKPAGYA